MGRRKLNIACIFGGELHSGGGFQTQLSTLLELEKIEDCSVLVFILTKDSEGILKAYGFKPIYLNLTWLDKAFMFMARQNCFFRFAHKYHLKNKFEKILQQYNIDLIYFLSPSSLALDLVCHNYIFTVWDLCHRDFCEFPEVNFYREFENREMLYTKVLKKAIAVLTDSDLGRENAIRRYNLDENRVYVAHYLPSVNVKETDYIDIRAKYNLNIPYIYYPAQFWAHKNHVYIIDGISILRKEGINIAAVFSGSDKGNLDYVLKYAEEKGASSLVKYIGFVPNEEIYHLYKQSLALVMPSYFGPTNIPPLEAFAIGTPVIYSDLAGLRDQVGDAALLCDLKEPESLADQIKMLLNNKEKREELINKGYVRLKELQSRSINNVLPKIIEDYIVKLKCWKR